VSRSPSPNIPDLALAPAVAQLVPRSIYERRIELFNDVWAERMLAPAVALLRESVGAPA